MSKDLEAGKHAPKMRFWMIICPIVAAVLSVLIFCINIKIRRTYYIITDKMNEYSLCHQSVFDFREASEYLTNQVRFFVVNQEKVYIDSYQYENLELKRREKAVAVMDTYHGDDEVSAYFERAITESKALADIEYYAMKLICDANKFSAEDLPEVVNSVELTAEDKNLSGLEKIQKATDLVYDYDYLSLKSRIMKYTAEGHTILENDFKNAEKLTEIRLNHLFSAQKFLVILLGCTFLFICGFVIIYILLPIYHDVFCIINGEKMLLKGADEMHTIAKAYNALCDKNAVTASVLKHKAEHDPLTGLINREAFAQIKKAYTQSIEPISYMMIDIDLFKQINDEFGHSIGDDVLRKISSLLIEQFRTTDYVARVGGDEFAIIMTEVGNNPEKIIRNKINALNKTLQNSSDGLPAVSLSVGVAFSDAGYNEELYKKADEALYKVKKNGRCNCSFFTEVKDGNKR